MHVDTFKSCRSHCKSVVASLVGEAMLEVSRNNDSKARRVMEKILFHGRGR